jgi:hypothetical protein
MAHTIQTGKVRHVETIELFMGAMLLSAGVLAVFAFIYVNFL